MAKKILIIDDEAVFRELMNNALTSYGYQCIIEDNPVDGILRLKAEPCDLLLLDIMMEPLDGWDTLDHIKALPHGRDTPIIMVSAKKLQADEVIRYGEQVDGFIPKPFVDTEFTDTITDFFSWKESLYAAVEAAKTQGVPDEICSQWVQLSRQIVAITQLKEAVGSFCLPEEGLTGEQCLAHKINLINRWITEKSNERNALSSRYPILTEGLTNQESNVADN
ncbi:MAG: response regulator [Methanospirillum sp.]|uniref:response regulator n=1 Tax=Methanospirillum sp. TaxID=45200 RepID=UPI00236FB4DC|nr:response regulator [Methanospirillum sp.]MDD1728222.1 response regulator [Methanospirillum sp.]